MSDKPSPRIVEIDMRGQVCPSTLLVAMDNLNRFAKDLHAGNFRLLIKTDNREALHTIPATAENMGYNAAVSQKEKHYEILVQHEPKNI